MRLRSTMALRDRARAGVEVCTTHWPHCPKYPDHPLLREQNRMDMELAEMLRRGRLLGQLEMLADAGYKLPGEFIRDAEHRPRDERVHEFFERYDLGKHFPWDKREPTPCKPRKLSDEEIRQRTEWAKAVREARLKKGNHPDPAPPWEKEKFDPELAEMIRRGRAAQAWTYDPELARMLGQGVEEPDPEVQEFWERIRREEEAEKAARIQALRDDEELARKLREALETWVNSPRRNSLHTQDVREIDPPLFWEES